LRYPHPLLFGAETIVRSLPNPTTNVVQPPQPQSLLPKNQNIHPTKLETNTLTSTQTFKQTSTRTLRNSLGPHQPLRALHQSPHPRPWFRPAQSLRNWEWASVAGQGAMKQLRALRGNSSSSHAQLTPQQISPIKQDFSNQAGFHL
jgi:hypothetical protein